MRNHEEMKDLILEKARTDKRIRAVLLNGSRANDKIEPDPYQDFDIVYVVTELEEFISNHDWTHFFGEKILWQLPDEMIIGYEEKDSFTYLMVFKDRNRIDLTLFPKQKLQESFIYDSLTKVWLDKDNVFNELPTASDKDYIIKCPSEKEFMDICNEFWWVSPYVAKAIMRKEIIHAKEIMEIHVRNMFKRIIEVYIGTQTHFSVSIGKGGKFVKNYLSESEYQEILQTYPNHEPDRIIHAMRIMMHGFSKYAKEVSRTLEYPYDLVEESNSIHYFNALLDQQT